GQYLPEGGVRRQRFRIGSWGRSRRRPVERAEPGSSGKRLKEGNRDAGLEGTSHRSPDDSESAAATQQPTPPHRIGHRHSEVESSVRERVIDAKVKPERGRSDEEAQAGVEFGTGDTAVPFHRKPGSP